MIDAMAIFSAANNFAAFVQCYGPALFVRDYGPLLGSALTGFTLLLAYIQFRRSNRNHHAADLKAIEAKQVEIYQRLELESLSVFRFEAEYRSIIPFYKSNLCPPEPHPRGMERSEAELTARKYYESTCNLFEIAVRLRKKYNSDIKLGEQNSNKYIITRDYIEDDVFGSWIAWFFDTACEWGFRAVWHDLRDNYAPQLRCDVFDPLVRELIAAWDAEHAAAPRANLTIPEEELAPIRDRFYQAVGKNFGCESALCWVNDIRAEPFPQPPRAFV